MFNLDYENYRTQQPVDVSSSIPHDAKAAGVRFQWAQYESKGSNTAVWIIDDVIIGPRCCCLSLSWYCTK